jgi:biotin carboxyl carrier protein
MDREAADQGDLAVRELAGRHRGGRRNRAVDLSPLATARTRPASRGRSVRRFSAVAVVAAAIGAPVALNPSTIAGEPVVAVAPEELVEDHAGDGETAGGVPGGAGQVFARYGDVDLVVPDDGVRLVAYHEAAYSDALAVEPVGTKVTNDNPTKFTDPGPMEGPEYAILNARDRPTAATSAIDVAMEPGAEVTSLVTGEVVHVEEYHLYGRHRDHRIELRPDARPDLVVVLIHVEQPLVEVGDLVVAGETVLAPAAVMFPFESQIDRYVGEPRGPHIHVEIKRAED